MEDYYFSEAPLAIERLRQYSSPAMTPIDKLRLELDERFANGARIANFLNRKMLAGIGRITRASHSHLSAVQPHFDALPIKYARLDVQLAANIYLRVPNSGGELELWDVSPLSPYSEVPKDWRSELPTSLKIKPRLGDLIIFNCRRPHAISEFSEGDRVTVQMFIGYEKGKSLQLWN